MDAFGCLTTRKLRGKSMNYPIEVKVAWATTAQDYLPFTALPACYHGKTVKLVIVEPNQADDLFGEPMPCDQG